MGGGRERCCGSLCFDICLGERGSGWVMFGDGSSRNLVGDLLFVGD